MNSTSEHSDASVPANRNGLIYTLTIIGAFLIIGFLVLVMYNFTQPPPLGQNRAAERSKALTELRAYESDQLNNAGWIDPAKGLVRLRIQDAMKIVEQQWGKDPAAARSNLVSRVEAANPPPPKPAPSVFE
jgi:hypothetical protein